MNFLQTQWTCSHWTCQVLLQTKLGRNAGTNELSIVVASWSISCLFYVLKHSFLKRFEHSVYSRLQTRFNLERLQWKLVITKLAQPNHFVISELHCKHGFVFKACQTAQIILCGYACTHLYWKDTYVGWGKVVISSFHCIQHHVFSSYITLILCSCTYAARVELHRKKVYFLMTQLNVGKLIIGWFPSILYFA